MSQSDFILPSVETYTWSERLCRSLFLNVLSMMKNGQITVREQGQEIAQLGSASELQVVVNINSPKAYPKLLLGGGVGAGEAYMDGLWDASDLTQLVQLFARNLTLIDKWENKFKWLNYPTRKIHHYLRRNSQAQAKKNIEAHYDLGNTLYTQFLDETMMYSSAIYPDSTSSLHEAQNYKLHTICNKLQLNENDHLLEIGTGWGGLAIHAAKHFGCKVTTTTISEEQYAWAKQWIEKESLEDKITLLKKDYRHLTGHYTKLVSIEMIEAVGKAYMSHFFQKCNQLLEEDGLMLIQAITIDDRRYEHYSKNVDFIQKYIFPGGFLPSQLALNTELKNNTNMMIRDLQDIGLDYAQTLKHWYEAFNQNKDNLYQHGYDDRFMRMWEFYLKYCEGGFLERSISTVQLVMSKPHFRSQLTRAVHYN
ncbi:class I SAM-dependent methyltransferase [Alteromonas sp. 5E99-2]|uniref:SAM-dependent methyltransferase n=1 Tax=Alteromonas sp. 5E99-2 TaxID=2817683 RepID=UPI001A988DDB|nr:cyclopropane-fatty-acyl-phospholipid synthase family protein [Alteromonas sp. 5E99-2]MBO1255274.1 class I SAM-dependent methyltransferase [Alteromonas sp. 5E99-2]